MRNAATIPFTGGMPGTTRAAREPGDDRLPERGVASPPLSSRITAGRAMVECFCRAKPARRREWRPCAPHPSLHRPPFSMGGGRIACCIRKSPVLPAIDPEVSYSGPGDSHVCRACGSTTETSPPEPVWRGAEEETRRDPGPRPPGARTGDHEAEREFQEAPAGRAPLFGCRRRRYILHEDEVGHFTTRISPAEATTTSRVPR